MATDPPEHSIAAVMVVFLNLRARG